MRKPVLLLSAVAALALAVVGLAGADTLGPITFEAPTYTVGGINGQNGWVKTGTYDSAVATVASYPAAAGYGFGAQALRISSSVTSGSFGDQTFAPSLTMFATEPQANASPGGFIRRWPNSSPLCVTGFDGRPDSRRLS